MKIIFRSLVILGIATLLVGCPKTKEEKGLAETLEQYEIIVRWAQWDAAVDYVSMEYQEDHPITRLEMDRLRLFKVTTYTVRSTAIFDEGMTARQTVEIKMFNKSRGVERTIIDEQEWRYNEEIKRWRLHSSLPDPTERY